MKFLKLTFAILLCSLFFSSCQKESVTPETISSQESTDLTLSNLMLEEGTLRFASADHFYQIADQISAMKDAELDRWEQSIGFTSFRTAANQALAEIRVAKTKEEADFLASRHQNLVKMELNSYVPKLDFTYAALSNADGRFFIGKTLNIVQGEYLISTENEHLEALDRAIRNPESFEAEGISITKFPKESVFRSCGNFLFDIATEGNDRVTLVFASKTDILAGLGIIVARSKLEIGARADEKIGNSWVINPVLITTSPKGILGNPGYSGPISVDLITIDNSIVNITFSDPLYFYGGQGFVRTFAGLAQILSAGTPVPETTIVSAYGSALSWASGGAEAVIDCQ